VSILFSLLFLVVCVEAVTEILVSSSIFQRPREFLALRSSFLGELVHRGYCTSVWVSAAAAWVFVWHIWAITPILWVSYLITVFVLHRLSNLFHELASKWLNRRPMSFAVHKTETVIMPGLRDHEQE
jgi:hypothetical protein